jgi:hypothetical protein
VITIDPILNKVVGGTLAGVLRTCIISNPLTMPILQSGWDLGLGNTSSSVGQNVSPSIGAGITGSLLPEPPTGSMYRIRGLTLTNAAGPAAAAIIQVLGTFSGSNYRRYVVPTGPTNQFDMASFWVGDAIRPDPAEGLNVQNTSSVSINVAVAFDVLPFPQGITDPAPY